MARIARSIILGGAAVFAAACAERVSSSLDSASSAQLDAAFTSAPMNFSSTTSSFGGESRSEDTAFMAGDDDDDHDGRNEGHHGLNGLLDGHDFMGGGLRADFLGGRIGTGRPFDHEDDDESRTGCNFNSTTGVITCTAPARNGITFTRTIAWKDAAGVAQPARTSTTNSVAIHTTVKGTRTRPSGRTTTVDHVSDLSVVGLAATSTQRTVNGTSAGTETTTGTNSVGSFTAKRVAGDTITGLVVPVASGRPSFPTAGTVVRSMTATLTRADGTTKTRSRREMITFDGSSTAKVVITRDGTTKNCTVPLPRGRITCS